jgi:hypothetical protein
MGTVYDLTTTTSYYSGSLYFGGNTVGPAIVDVSVSAQLTGSRIGTASSWAAIDVLAASSVSLVASGTWQGVAYSQGVRVPVTESYDRFTTTGQGSPNVNQSLGEAAWDPFPIPPPPPVPPAPQRDLTRFRKAYSSQRMQPRPVRLSRG